MKELDHKTFVLAQIEREHPGQSPLSPIRAAIRQVLGEVVSEDQIQDIELVVTELGSNALKGSDDGRVEFVLLDNNEIQISTDNTYEPESQDPIPEDLLTTKEQICALIDESEVAKDALCVVTQRLATHGRGGNIVRDICGSSNFVSVREGGHYRAFARYQYHQQQA